MSNSQKMIQLDSGLQLYVEDGGQGEALIMVPGWAYSCEVFQYNAPLLAELYRCIRYDPRSHGRSQVTQQGNDYNQHGEDLHQLIEQLGLDKVHLLGWSLGVYDCLAYLQAFGSSKVKSLIMVDESPKIIRESANCWGEGSPEDIAGLIDIVNSEAYLVFFRDYMAEGYLGQAPSHLLDRFTELASSLNPGQAAGLLRNASEMDFRELLTQITKEIPSLIITREDWSENARAWVKEHSPQTQFEVLGGHLMLMEFPDKFNALVLKFLNHHNKRQQG